MLKLNYRFIVYALTLLCAPPLLAQTAGERLQLGAALTLQHPIGDYHSEVLDSDAGYGLGFRARYALAPHHGLAGRLGYDWYTEGGGNTQGSNYILMSSIQVREVSWGLDYEWRYNGGQGGYLLAGPVFRRWSDRREYNYVPILPGSIPASHTDSTTPSSLGYSIGWGYQTSSQDCLDLRLVDSAYGSTGFRATTLQWVFAVYW